MASPSDSADSLADRFGSLVRQLRESRGWSQEELAEHAELNRGYVGEIERGGAMPSLATIDKLAIAFRLNPSVLIARIEAGTVS